MNTTKQKSQWTNRKNARWAGVFYIVATVAPLLTYFFIRFLEGGVGGEPLPDYLIQIAANESQISIGVLLELTYALAVIGIISTLYPILRKHNEALALAFSGLRFMEAISVMVHSLILLILLSLSQEYTASGMPGSSYFQTAGTIFLAARDWAFLIGSGIIWSLSALLLNILLYQEKLIPRWLSTWGLVGATLSLVAYILQLFNINLAEFLFLPIGVQEMVFAVWLIVKGIDNRYRS